ncbi:putative Glucose-6-phosphate 1-epimerase [Hibiscus syriacus]|uniref:Glucose-6-phosphate 1-epimerase n=1 Tax=Hibiscus syriacus TaxID=106335 RepID=A0A6A2WJH3_HIBSY|nr:putative Glucose-6-phosphate 1-epimerase [Hibiscus syriacus]
MQLPNQHPRINLIELKAQLIKTLGSERSQQGERVKLHNLLICSILKNVCNAKVPPPPTTIHESLQTEEVLLSSRKARSGAPIRLTAKTASASYESTITNDVVSENQGKLLVIYRSLFTVLKNFQAKQIITIYAKSYDIGGLLDTVALRELMKQIATQEGLEGVSMDCAAILNNGLDVYLKSVSMSYHNQIHANSWYLEAIDEHRYYKLVSLLGFKVAMELNPQKLGEDWPVLLEKI